MSACFIKQGKWERAIDASDKVLAAVLSVYMKLAKKMHQ
jgi:hypothetical protein